MNFNGVESPLQQHHPTTDAHGSTKGNPNSTNLRSVPAPSNEQTQNTITIPTTNIHTFASGTCHVPTASQLLTVTDVRSSLNDTELLEMEEIFNKQEKTLRKSRENKHHIRTQKSQSLYRELAAIMCAGGAQKGSFGRLICVSKTICKMKTASLLTMCLKIPGYRSRLLSADFFPEPTWCYNQSTESPSFFVASGFRGNVSHVSNRGRLFSAQAGNMIAIKNLPLFGSNHVPTTGQSSAINNPNVSKGYFGGCKYVLYCPLCPCYY